MRIPLPHVGAAALAAIGAATLLLPLHARSAGDPQRLTYRSGPIEIGGYETKRASANVPGPPGDTFLTGMRAEVVDASGRPVPQQRVMLHHVLFMNKGRFRGDRRSTDCVRNTPHEKFYGTGEEAQALVLPRGYGYRLRDGDRWRMGYMLMNHTSRPARVYLRYTVDVDPAKDLAPVVPHWVTLACRNAKIFNVAGGGAPGSVSRHSRDWSVPRAGRIVAGMAHAHGGTLGVDLTQPRCDERRLLSSDPAYGAADDPIYRLSPVLHEPSPRSLSVATSATGWPVQRGERLRMTAKYDAERPHVAVMGIMHVYIAPGAAPAPACPPLPADVETHRLPFPGAPGRPAPPRVIMDISVRGRDGRARPIEGVPGPTRVLRGDARIDLRDIAFRPRKLSVPRGATVRWRVAERVTHDVTVARGPRGFASTYMRSGRAYARTLRVPGTYKLFCSVHPADMSQEITVR